MNLIPTYEGKAKYLPAAASLAGFCLLSFVLIPHLDKSLAKANPLLR